MTALPVGKLPNDMLRGLIASLDQDPDVIIGPGVGRDAAAVRAGDQILVFKTDPITFPTDDAGWYLVNINANDIACMGAEPKWLLVTALLPEHDTTPKLVDSVFTGLRNACEQIGCSLIGGHTEITEGLDRPILVGQMIGTATADTLTDPSNARANDAVMLAGGIAIEGTSILAMDAAETLGESLDDDLLRRARAFDRTPGISVVPYARRLTRSDHLNVRAMHDPTEGGLATGLIELAEATGLGIEIDHSAVLVHPETSAITDALGIDPWGLIASGALLFVVPEDQVDGALRTLEGIKVPVARIGRLTANANERTLVRDGVRDAIPVFEVDEIARYFSSD
jgi:hydrogenase expression/formation protein HypE